jgi:hypothetical protein
MGDYHMLEGKDLLNLELCVVDGLIDQLTAQEGSILHLVRPGELLASTGIALEKERLNQIAKDLIAEIDALSLTEVNLE